MSEQRWYGRRELVEAYLGCRDGERYGGYRREAGAFNAALRAHHQGMLDGLERLFEVRLTPEGIPDPVLHMLFRSTVESVLALTDPWSGFLEAGLLHLRLDRAGEAGTKVMAASDRIWSRNNESREDHLIILEELVGLFLGDRAHHAFTADELRALGVDLQRPRPVDYFTSD
ncbi:hypothetical protein [Actinoplanes derwentensis]|uniref:Uncharacterized protein n=1 Tax=Actinoplanes derwentensis TaxID=113562 RepID=A0A1H2A688_9ACTN|nr:hypothetical protein [Actinoplanes derwentensis]GID90359.1 hypothetical protein Ade03nite_92830 [Actinoplanes derwentensis]SDT41399.1 hypothetical protein SAMN04489716_3682 [Actinoplanes derwentensis]